MINPEVPISAEQHEWWQRAWVALVEDRREFAELFEEVLREDGGLSATTIHQFSSSEKFLDAPNIDDYDVCFVDGELGFGNMRGYEAVPLIKARRPDLLVIGITDVLMYLNAFAESGADFWLKKKQLTRRLPEILRLVPPQE